MTSEEILEEFKEYINKRKLYLEKIKETNLNPFMQVFKVNEIVGEGKSRWQIKEFTFDSLNLVNLESPKRIRPLPYELIFEYITYLLKNPAPDDEDMREILKESENASFDKFLYGFRGTLSLIASEYIKRKTAASFKKTVREMTEKTSSYFDIFPIYSATSFSITNFSTIPFARKYIRSLLSKPFVILTGNSGTGKTRIATRFAKYLEKNTDGGLKNHLLLPVGADWTDNTKILGFYNPLKKEYQSTPVLDFILLAKENPAVPFFLILDEMNLSHVERYFSDFLSAMESGEPIPLYKKEGTDSPIPEEIELPKNLFVTGTVNIDETTYMFSPKVLDRANVIEFKPEMGDVLANLLDESEDDEIAPAEPGVAEGFMQLANEVRSGKIPDEVKTLLSEMKPIFESVYAELEKYGFEFAFRTAKEIRLYALASYKTAESEKPAAAQIADVQLLQKILPKIHGNRKQIGTLLDDLEKLCESYQLENSLAKIRQMKDKLSKTQYVSFI